MWSCLCNSCHKRKTCSDCKHIALHVGEECYRKGITDCSFYVASPVIPKQIDEEDKYESR